MIPHFVTAGEVIVAVDFERRIVLTGELAKRGDPKSVYRHIRRRYVDGVWHRDRARKSESPMLPIDADDFAWMPVRVLGSDKPVTSSTLLVRPERRYASVDRTEIVRALQDHAFVTAKATDVSGLVEVVLEPRHARFASLGRCGVLRSLEIAEARDGLGRCVVLGLELLRALREMGSARVLMRIDPHAAALHVTEQRGTCSTERVLWTARHAATVAPPAVDAWHLPIGEALARALPFASADADRPNMRQVRIDVTLSHVAVEASDGHIAHREIVAGAYAWPPTLGAVQLPTSVVKRLTKGRTPKRLGFVVDNERVWVKRGDTWLFADRNAPAFPPVDMVLRDGSAQTVRIELSHDARLAWAEAVEDLAPKKPGATLRLRFTPTSVQVQTVDDGSDEAPVALVDLGEPQVFGEGREFETDVVFDYRYCQRPWSRQGKPCEAAPLAVPYYVDARRLADALASMDEGSAMTLHVQSPTDPLVFRTSKQQHILMPLDPTKKR